MRIAQHAPEISADKAFALMLETACEDFENLLYLIDGSIKVVVTTDKVAQSHSQVHRFVRAPARIQMALAKSFLFYANRANRICWKNKAQLKLDRDERERFLKSTEPLTLVRDVNEHGYDGDIRSQKHKPSMHPQESGGMGDETSLTIDGRDKILMGPLNLYTIYLAVDRMRRFAGFTALHGKRLA